MASAVGAAPRVAVSIGPVHSLVAAVMLGAGAPDLLVEGGASPHDQALRPSQARLLQSAALIVWVGPALETFLDKPIRSLASPGRVITLVNEPAITLLPTRNPHIWLDPDNAAAIAAIVADRLGEIDAVNAGLYRRNAASLARRIDALAAEIETGLAPVKARPYMVLHDAYRYFEDRFAMNALGAVVASPGYRPGAKRLLEIRRRIRSQRAVCVFGEPQASSALLGAIVEGTPVRIGMLDPLGAGLPVGPAAYFRLMRGIAASLTDCLAR